MIVQLIAPGYSSARLLAVVNRILTDTALCSMATRSEAGVVNLNAAFFSVGEGLDLYFLSNPSSTHCRNLTRVAEMAVLVCDSRQEWGQPHAGLQLYGEGGPTMAGHAERARASYAARFPRYFDLVLRAGEASDAPAGVAALRFYQFRPKRVKILDEQEFGDDVYVPAAILV